MGARKWKNIARHMPGRTERQCRDRYKNYLMPGYFTGQWTREEDEMFLNKHKELGSKWSLMTKFFTNRNANTLMSRWNYFVSRHTKELSDNKACNQLKDDEIDRLFYDNNDEKNNIIDQNEDYLENFINRSFSFVDFDEINEEDE